MAFKRTRKELEAELQAEQSPYVVYGTPLPPLDPEVRDDGSSVPIWQQEVRDERGRKRLHGAFTGGYSAGYFNTVGSKEGFTPSTFVSSRSNRAKDGQNKQRAEDFMDDEDLTERAATQAVQTNQDFSALGTTDQDGGHNASIMDVVRTETMGITLLQKMGWKQGQGIGGTDSRMIQFNRKDDTKGLGYEGEARLDKQTKAAEKDDDSEDDGGLLASRIAHDRSKEAGSKTKAGKKSGFGVGVLNDDGSDDDDPFAIGPKISYHRSIKAEKKSKKKAVQESAVVKSKPNPLLKTQPIFRSTKPEQPGAPSRRCHDGKLPLPGFILAQRLTAVNLEDSEKYAPPKVPEEWKPSKLEAKGPGPQPEYKSTADAAKASKLDARDRAIILGEKHLPGKSVFDFISPAARDRLATSTQNQNIPPGRGERMPPKSTSGTGVKEPSVPDVDKTTAQAALERGSHAGLLGNTDEAKRVRYATIVQYWARLNPDPPQRPPTLSPSQWAQELDEFVKAAKASKPLPSIMAKRFTSASSKPAVGESADQAVSSKKTTKPKDPAEEAAAVGMFGPMTRSYHRFYPARIVCKRFNVRLPAHVEAEGEGQPSKPYVLSASGKPTAELVSAQAMQDIKSQAGLSRFTPGPVLQGSDKAQHSESEARVPPVEVDTTRNEAIEGPRASDDLFKAVFGDEDDD